ncbi:MAG: methylated-DNA--[protein]-cysteine S-methyltransferase [Candidatus Hydrogenedentes bacterium]|nr:methylated-DNA--[protein]-cysteine S-methyltransferase [Candidatus Hydrogenedentota bacterium]
MDAANFRFDHPLGPIYGWFTADGLSRLRLPGTTPRRRLALLHSSANDHRVWALHAALERYFAGLREDFAAIPIDLVRHTPFRQTVWEAARAVPWGDTSTYGELARRIGNPKAARAVGQALGANPVPILVPCHRFLAAGGGLGGFSAGLHWKRELLRVEGLHA